MMKGIIVSSALILAGLGLATPTLAQSDESPVETEREMEMEMVDMTIEGIEEGKVMRVSDTSVFPDYKLIIVSGPDDQYYTFYTKDTELEIGDEVYLSENQLYLDDDMQSVVAVNYEMASKEYFTRAATMPMPETVTEERRVETRDTVVIERPPVQVEQPAMVETQPTTPVRALW